MNVSYASIQCDDTDGDGICDELDNCALVPNIDQADANADDIGDACSERICAGDDYFVTVAGSQIDFGGGDFPPIPADFFGPGSDPFDGLVPLEGVPVDPAAGHNAGQHECGGGR